MGDLPMGDLPVVLVWPMLTSALLGWAAPRLARALPPALAVRLLAAGAVICAASTTLVLALTAWLLLAEIPVVAALGHWSAPQVDLRQPVPDIVEALAGAAWVVMIGRVSAATVSFTRSTLAAPLALRCSQLDPTSQRTVHHEVCATGEARDRTGQEGHGGSHLLCRTHSSCRDERQRCREHLRAVTLGVIPASTIEQRVTG